ncbi:MAG: cell division topological specificity factor MinE [Clostridiales bacterium]|jgi:cell division topological specificity factor|nr:cell division topological specificity factor MinE [Clostridiales bacterium]
MMDLFRSSARRSTSSKNVAKERLKLVLVHDRVNVSSTFLEMIKGDLIKVISDYMEIDEDNLEVRMTKTKRDEDDTLVPALVANIPIKRMKGAIR